MRGGVRQLYSPGGARGYISSNVSFCFQIDQTRAGSDQSFFSASAGAASAAFLAFFGSSRWTNFFFTLGNS